MANELLPIALEAAVMLRIADLKRLGGPNTADYEAARATADVLASKGDVLMYGSSKRGEVAAIFTEVAHAMAVMAFSPGGYTAFGIHFEASL